MHRELLIRRERMIIDSESSTQGNSQERPVIEIAKFVDWIMREIFDDSEPDGSENTSYPQREVFYRSSNSATLWA